MAGVTNVRRFRRLDGSHVFTYMTGEGPREVTLSAEQKAAVEAGLKLEVPLTATDRAEIILQQLDGKIRGHGMGTDRDFLALLIFKHIREAEDAVASEFARIEGAT